MKGYFDSKINEALTLAIGNEYDITYDYDETGRITKETVSGTVTRVTSYAYNAADNIVTETIVIGEKTVTKTYGYDEFNNIKTVSVRVTPTV